LEYLLKAEACFAQEMAAGKDDLQPQWGYSTHFAFTPKVYEKMGDREKAEQYYHKALRANPKDQLARDGLNQLTKGNVTF
jgi:tetratricopeptide (TPR) repeat protein